MNNSDDSYVIKDDIKDNFFKVDMASSRPSSPLGRICTKPRVREELQICFIVSVLIVVCLRFVFFSILALRLFNLECCLNFPNHFFLSGPSRAPNMSLYGFELLDISAVGNCSIIHRQGVRVHWKVCCTKNAFHPL